MIAIFPSLGWQEMFLLLVIGLLLYGRNLPDAGRSLGRVVAQLKRSFHDFKDQLDRDGELGDVKKALQDTAREVKNVAKVPRALSNPSDTLRNLTHEAMSSPVEEPAKESPVEEPARVSTVDEAATASTVEEAAKESPVEDAADGHAAEESESGENSVVDAKTEPKSTNDRGEDRDEASNPSTGSPGS